MNPNPLKPECGRACDEFAALLRRVEALTIKVTLLEAQNLVLVAAAEDFITKVDSGRARSVDSYNKFRKALGKV